MDELLAGMFAHERRTQELVTSLLGEVSEDNSDEEDEVEEMWIVQDLLSASMTRKTVDFQKSEILGGHLYLSVCH